MRAAGLSPLQSLVLIAEMAAPGAASLLPKARVPTVMTDNYRECLQAAQLKRGRRAAKSTG